MIIGLSGYARSGKDSVAAILTERHGFTRKAFADPLRAALYALDPIVGRNLSDPVRYAELIDDMGYEGARRTRYAGEIRRLLQRLGTEVGRDMFGQDFWVDRAMRLDPGRYVFTDCRFLNEAQAVTDTGGEIWRVNRPGVGPVNDHISETGLDGWPFDRHVNNDGTLLDLTRAVSAALHSTLRSTP